MTSSSPVMARPAWSARFLLTNEFGLVLLIALAFSVFALLLPGYTKPFALFTLGRQIGIDTMIGLAMMAVIVTGGLDLSVGAVGVAAAMVFGWLLEGLGLPLVAAIPVALGFGALLGGMNGAAIVWSGVHSFIVTLATMSIFFGAMIYLTRAEAFRGLPPEVAAFGKLKLAGVVSPLFLLSLVACLLLWLLYTRTLAGREMLAAGANRRAAEVSGIRAGRIIALCHALAGGLAAAAALMLTARTGAAVPSMAGHLGADWLLPAFLAPVLGGTLLTGGQVSVFGTLLGAAFVNVTTSGLLMLRVGEFWIQAVLGLLLLAAVLADRARQGFLRKRGAT